MQLLSELNFIEGFPVVDTNGGKTSDWVGGRSYQRITVLFAAAAGTGDSVITLNQAKDVSGTGSKALNFTTFYYKAATTDQTATPNWTKVTQAAGNTATVASWANKSKLCAIEFHQQELDFVNGFYFLNAVLSGASASTLGYVLFLVGQPLPYLPPSPVDLPSAIS
jgi:hypothetical protein